MIEQLKEIQKEEKNGEGENQNQAST